VSVPEVTAFESPVPDLAMRAADNTGLARHRPEREYHGPDGCRGARNGDKLKSPAVLSLDFRRISHSKGLRQAPAFSSRPPAPPDPAVSPACAQHARLKSTRTTSPQPPTPATCRGAFARRSRILRAKHANAPSRYTRAHCRAPRNRRTEERTLVTILQPTGPTGPLLTVI
jgi:hypothetical protein